MMKFQALAYKEDLVPCPSISTVRKPSRDTWNVHEARESNFTNFTMGGTLIRHSFSDSSLYSPSVK